MTSMMGKRMFVYFTGSELPAVLPLNNGQAIAGSDIFSFVTLLGEVTGETPGGLWFRLEKMFDAFNTPLEINLLDKPEYFLAWSAFRRALLAKESDTQPPERKFGFDANRIR